MLTPLTSHVNIGIIFCGIPNNLGLEIPILMKIFYRRSTKPNRSKRPQGVFYWDSVHPTKSKPIIDYGTR